MLNIVVGSGAPTTAYGVSCDQETNCGTRRIRPARMMEQALGALTTRGWAVRGSLSPVSPLGWSGAQIGWRCLPGVILACPVEILPAQIQRPGPVFNQLRLVRKMLQKMADEVARNGALQRITSARGFLERPIAFCAAKHLVKLVFRPSPRLITPEPASRAHQFLPGATS